MTAPYDMRYQIVRDALRRMLVLQAQGVYSVVGYQRSGKDAGAVANRRLVEVYYRAGKFPKGAGLYGPSKHDATFNVDLTVSVATKMDVSVIESGDASAEQIAAALAEMKESGAEADKELDSLAAAVYQILMDARNDHLGLPSSIKIGSRWITDYEKDEPIKSGAYTVLTGRLTYTCSIDEELRGYTPITIDEPNITVDLQLEGDATAEAGVEVGG
jgi:hypothetical protein